MLKYVVLPSPEWVYKKHVGQKNFLMFIPENFFLVTNIL